METSSKVQSERPPLAALLLSSVDPCPVEWGDGPFGPGEVHRPECETLDLFLEAGCEQRLEDLRAPSWQPASTHAKRIYLLHMRKRRQALKDLALQYLPETWIESLGVSSSVVLDANVVALVETLQALKIQLSPELEGLHREYTYATSGGSIYHYVQNVVDAEIVWDLGFRDVSALDKHGRSAISKTRDVPYIGWLRAHGVDVFATWPVGLKQAGNTTITHYVASVIMAEIAQEGHNANDRTSIGQLAPVLFSEIHDGCGCRCANGHGCSPLLSGLKAACRTTAGLEDIYDAFIESFAAHINLEVAKAVTRLFTFEALSLPHTCCVFEDNDFRRQHVEADIPELDKVFPQEIKRFGEYIDVFPQELEALHDHSAINAEILKDFLHTRWTNTMQDELTRDFNEDTDRRHLDEAAALGVVWHATGPDETPNFSSLEYWVGEIDRISEGKPTTYQNYRTV
ncbi:hypothetical protein PG997_014008 [Apiospora hydei]|uniref:Uncharacterized protein n=1 Tax=Apiospora hydei TaxID=1337664 RepID=A0ABR1V7U5_9PEZI